MTGDTLSLLLVGCGKMGGALLAGWIERRIASAIAVVEPSPEAVAPFRGRPGVTAYDDLRSLPPGLAPDIVVFATKPQGIEAVVPGYRRFAPAALFLSIAAGKTIASFEAMLGDDAAVVRAIAVPPRATRLREDQRDRKNRRREGPSADFHGISSFSCDHCVVLF